METFEQLYSRAAGRKGGATTLARMLATPLPPNELALVSDDRILAEFTKKVFQSGFVWRVVENKWPNFESSFFNFDIEKVLMMPEEMMERKASDPSIIRNFNKVKTIKANGLMIFEQQQNGQSFAQFIANWPSDNIIGLWEYLKKQGSRLGGNTGPYALRKLGKDTFLLSRDVEAYFRANKLIEGGLNSKKSLKVIQETFNQWQQESGLSLQELSQIVAYSTGDNYLHLEETTEQAGTNE